MVEMPVREIGVKRVLTDRQKHLFFERNPHVTEEALLDMLWLHMQQEMDAIISTLGVVIRRRGEVFTETERDAALRATELYLFQECVGDPLPQSMMRFTDLKVPDYWLE